jgi:hypothetical protein
MTRQGDDCAGDHAHCSEGSARHEAQRELKSDQYIWGIDNLSKEEQLLRRHWLWELAGFFMGWRMSRVRRAMAKTSVNAGQKQLCAVHNLRRLRRSHHAQSAQGGLCEIFRAFSMLGLKLPQMQFVC